MAEVGCLDVEIVAVGFDSYVGSAAGAVYIEFAFGESDVGGVCFLGYGELGCNMTRLDNDKALAVFAGCVGCASYGKRRFILYGVCPKRRRFDIPRMTVMFYAD